MNINDADRSFGEAWARRGSRSFGPGSVGTYLGEVTVGAGIFHDFPSILLLISMSTIIA